VIAVFSRILEGRRPRRLRTARTLSLQHVFRSALIGLLLLACLHPVFANPGKLFLKGNQAYAEGRFEEAVNAYQEAIGDAPESAELHFNLGNALFRAKGFEEAVASFEIAASLARTDSLRSQSWYNLANCMVRTGEGLRESDARAAANYCHQAAGLYRIALDYDSNFTDAAYNLEICQRIAAGIDDEIREQEEKEQQKNELIKYIREKLTEFIQRQTALLDAQGPRLPQKTLEQETRALAKVMVDSGLHLNIPLPDGTQVPGPLKETYGHTVNAADAMTVPDQQTALAELVAALGAAPEDPGQQDGESDEDSDEYEDYDMEYEESDEDADMYEEADPFGDFSEYEEIRGVPPPNQTEMDILAEELRNLEERKKKRAGEYKSVEKDW